MYELWNKKTYNLLTIFSDRQSVTSYRLPARITVFWPKAIYKCKQKLQTAKPTKQKQKQILIFALQQRYEESSNFNV